LEDKDYIKELFSEKLKNHQAPVNPELWSAISSSISSTAGLSTGLSLVSKLIIGISAAVVITTVSVLLIMPSKVEINKKPNQDRNLEVDSQKMLSSENTQEKESVKTNIDASKEENVLVVPNDTQDRKSELAAPSVSTESQDYVFEKANRTHEVKIQENTVLQKETDLNQTTQVLEERKLENNLQNVDKKETYFLAPLTTIFTPNGDNLNDNFALENSGLKDFTLIVLDDKGQKVYYTEDTKFQWDGRGLNGEEVPDGNYVYFLVAKDEANQTVSKHNTLVIKRK